MKPPETEGLDLSICIAHAGDALGLWATIHSCEADLAGSDLKYEYRLCLNGLEYDKGYRSRHGNPLSLDLLRLTEFLSKAGKLGYLRVVTRPLSPPTARQMAADGAKGELLFFFDNHCLVAKGYFQQACKTFREYPADIVHSVTRFFSGEKDVYHYKLSLEKNFWAAGSFSAPPKRPYRIAAGGHGGFAVRRSVWEALEGYWTGFEGYGGEEMYFDLKAAMMGYTNYLDPALLHYHYAGQRPYPRHYTDNFYRNMMMCANIIGGEDWLYRVYESFENRYPKSKTPTFELLMQAHEKSQPHRLQLEPHFEKTLDEQLRQFKDQGVAH